MQVARQSYATNQSATCRDAALAANDNLRQYANDNCATNRAYKYDMEGRLVEIQQPGGLKLTYLYDGLGRRISNVVNNNGTVTSLTRVWCGTHYAEGNR